jgi:hypothetical protein
VAVAVGVVRIRRAKDVALAVGVGVAKTKRDVAVGSVVADGGGVAV